MDQKPSIDKSQQPLSKGTLDNSQLQELKNQITKIHQDTISTSIQPGVAQNHHYLWFFPDLKDWMQLANRGKFVILLSVLSLALISFLAFNYNDFRTYKKSHYKYQYLFYASEDAESFRKYDQEWSVDSVRVLRMKWVDRAGLR